jgi:serine/threonine protein kinase
VVNVRVNGICPADGPLADLGKLSWGCLRNSSVTEPVSEKETDRHPAVDDQVRISVLGEGKEVFDEADLLADSWQKEHVLEPGAVLSKRYEVVAVIGSGGMGIVYKVKHIHLHKYLALKTVRSPYLSKATTARFRKEAKAASALNHPGLITVYDFGMLEDGQPFMVMDLIENGSLSDAIKAHGPLPTERVLDIFEQATEALGYAHENKIIHRDLKPSNILLTEIEGEGERVIIADFGVAKMLEDDSGASMRLTQTGGILGSPLYMSPEQCAGKTADQRSDIYSLACAMFEALTGSPPFRGESPLATLLLHQKLSAPTLTQAFAGKNFSEELEEVFAKSLAKDPEQRYQSMQELNQILVALNACPVIEEKKGPIKRRDGKKLDRKPIIVPLPIAALLIVAGILLSSFLTVVVFGCVSRNDRESVLEERLAPMDIDNVDLISKWSQPPQANERTQKVAGKRIFHFPEKYSIGFLYMATSRGSADPLGHAVGTLSVPLNAVIRFRPNWAVCEIPYAFNRFAADDLESIDFANLPVTDQVLEHISHIKSLRYINLSNTEITDVGLQHIVDLPILDELDLGNTNLTSSGIAALTRVKSLRELNLSNLPINEKAVKYLQQATNLVGLTICNSTITDSDIRALSGLKNLRMLRIDSNQRLTGECLKYVAVLPSLIELHICGCKIKPEATRYLKTMPKLTFINIFTQEWTPTEKAEFRAQLPRCILREKQRGRGKRLNLD